MRKFLIIFSLIFIALAASAQKSVKLGLRSSGSIGVGDKFQITVRVENVDGTPKLPSNVPGAKLLYPDPVESGYGSSMVSGTGMKTQKSEWVEYTFTLKATEKGTFSVGPISVGGVSSNKLSYSIGSESHAQAQASQPAHRMPSFDDDDDIPDPHQAQPSGLRFVGKGNDNLFMRAEVSKTTAYEQEAILYTVKLYTTYAGISFIGATESPKFDGFVLEESKNTDVSVKLETYNGKTYKTAVIARYVIFPQMTGSLKIQGNKYTIAARSEKHYYDPLFGDLYPSYPVQLSVQPNDVSVNVLPLPTPKPANFSGGVGKFSISAALPSKNLATNQASSIVYTISGTGNLKYVTLPDLNNVFPPQMEVYTPTSTVNAAVNGSNLSGNVKLDYSFMPLQEGEFTIPSVELVYFNPATKSYETARSNSFKVKVAKGKESAKSQTREKAVFTDDLMPVGSDLSKEHSIFAGTVGYWLAYVIPFILLAVIIFWRRAYIKANADIIAVRSRKAHSVANKRLRKAAACMKRNDSNAFYDELLIALWGFAADKLKMPGSELNRDNIKERLLLNGVEESFVNEFIKVIDDAEFAKYAPGDAAELMNNSYQAAANVINDINKSVK
jgi:hypothetical protein